MVQIGRDGGDEHGAEQGQRQGSRTSPATSMTRATAKNNAVNFIFASDASKLPVHYSGKLDGTIPEQLEMPLIGRGMPHLASSPR